MRKDFLQVKKMLVKGIDVEDFVNYKKCSLYVAFPNCTFKCGKDICQNSILACTTAQEISPETLYLHYEKNQLTEAVVCGGLEPFDSPNDLADLVFTWRVIHHNADDIVIYTGYTEDELKYDKTFQFITAFKNIIIKFGRFIPNSESIYDEVLGVTLQSKNQYAKKYE